MILESKCITCGAEAHGCWFCPTHNAVKEAAYAQSRRLGESWLEVMARRDAALRASEEV